MKHLIVLFDGTQNSAATGHYEDITNIFRLNLAISRHDKTKKPQIISYVPGPGTRGFIDQRLGGATGQGIDEIIREAYVNLASNYSPGDMIYLFGFSRGAVAARALSCLIAESGLLKPQRLYLLPAAWKRFVNINQDKELHPGLQDLTEYVHPDVRIKFMGLFDSVLGRDHAQPSHFSDLVFSNQAFSRIVDVGIHLLSMDDTRSLFSPMLWDSFDPNVQHVEQIWMPGVHSDIGGTGRPHFLGIAAFMSMICKIKKHTELKINQEFLDEMTARLETADNLLISDERYNAVMQAIRQQSRSPSQQGVAQFVHQLAAAIYKRNIFNRNQMSIYDSPHIKPFLDLPVADDDCSDMLVQQSRIVLGKLH